MTPPTTPRAHGPPRTGQFPRPPWPAPPRLSPARSAAPALALDPPISLGQLAHPRTPSIPSIPSIPPRTPLAVGAGSRPPGPTATTPTPTPTPTPARAGHRHGGPGRPRQGWLRATVPAHRRRRATTLRPPAARPRDAPTRRPAHRLAHRLSGPRRPPLVRANAPGSKDDSQGDAFCTKCGPPGLEHPSQVANWQTHPQAPWHAPASNARAGILPNLVTAVPSVGSAPPNSGMAALPVRPPVPVEDPPSPPLSTGRQCARRPLPSEA